MPSPATSSRKLIAQARRVLAACRARGWRLATAESCTGGLIAAMLTEIPGSSDVVERGFVTYSDASKSDLLGVPAATVKRHGAVSEPVARRMADGARRRARVDVAVAVTGVAGPGGGTERKPVGLVHLACAARTGQTVHVRKVFAGDRAAIRRASVAMAFELLLAAARRRSRGP